MSNIRNIIVSSVTGITLSIAWWILFDGVIVAGRDVSHPFWWYYWLPAVLTTVFMILLNLVKKNEIGARGDADIAVKARIWVFLVLTAAIVSLGGSVWVLVADFSMADNTWPGASLVIQCGLVLAAGLLFFLARDSNS